MVPRNRMCKIRIRLASKRPSSKDQFITTYTQRPPIDRIAISFLGQYFRGYCKKKDHHFSAFVGFERSQLHHTHVCHAPSYSIERPAFRIMYSNVEICDVGMSPFVKKDVIGFKIAMNDSLLV